jgi:DNA-binding MarR family transcriptional regulator
MNGELRQQLLRALFYFKKALGAMSRPLPETGGDNAASVASAALSPAELAALSCIDRCGTANQTAHYAMHETLSVSKAAVSQMLGSLEKRGFIRRETDLENRRKIIVTVTKKGKSAVDTGQKRLDDLMSRIILQFGEKDVQEFVRLLEHFVKVVDEETK